MTTWTFIWLAAVLKIPVVALFLLVRWALRPPEEAAPGHDGGIGPRARPPHPHHPRSHPPRISRRGPHGGGDRPPMSPPRVRTAPAMRGRLRHH